MKENSMTKKKFKELVKDFKKDPIQHANKIIDILLEVEKNDSKTLANAIASLHKIFVVLLKNKSIKRSSLPDDVQDANEKFSHWLFLQYERTHKTLIGLLSNEGPSIRELALISIIKLIQAEGRNPIGSTGKKKHSFPKQRYAKLINYLVSDSNPNKELISHLQQYMEYQDVIFNTVQILSNIVKQHKDNPVTEIYVTNLFWILEQIDIPPEGKFLNPQTLVDDNAVQPTADPCSETEDEEESVRSDEICYSFKYEEVKRHYNGIWMQMIRYKLPLPVYKKCLILIPDKVIMHLKSPVKLTDFFMEAYDIGGAFSLLALQGVFMLINKHNLDYPDFYMKLYSLLEPNILQAKYKPRFFMLLNLFLSSTHLPEYLAASFIKKLSRLSLVAPSHSLVLIVKFIANLIVRFPSLRKLINNPESEGIEADPFDPTENDPSKTKASKSSLWEIATLKNHLNPSVSKAAAFVDRNPPDLEVDLSPFVEVTYDELFEKATKIHMKEIPTTFHKPVSLFNYKDDQMSTTWTLY